MADPITVDVVRAHLEDIGDLSRFRSVLSEDERARASGYKVAQAQAAFTLARGLLRLELSKRLEVEPRDIHFENRPSGKPDVRTNGLNRPDVRFSVSHTGPHVFIAFAPGADVGIDIERLDRTVTPLEIAKRYFTAEELLSLEALSVEARPRAFLAGWTRKEAIVKARGNTMAASLTTLTVGLQPEEIHPTSRDSPDVPARATCRLTTFEFPALNLIGAVAIQAGQPAALRFEVLKGARFD